MTLYRCCVGLHIRRAACSYYSVLLSDRQTAMPPPRWRRGAVVSGVHRTNEVNARRVRLVPGWVTVFGRVYHLGMT